MIGSVEKRGENSWRLVVSFGMKDGKQVKHNRTVHCKSEAEARKLLPEFYTEVERGLVIDGKKMTFKDFVERWLKDYAEVNLAPKTLYRYQQMLDSRILPAMGHLRMDKIRPTHIIEFEKNLRENGIRLDGKPGGLSDRTVLHHYRLISAILQDAVQWQVIKDNPAARTKPPKVKKTRVSAYDEVQSAQLLKALETEPLKHKLLVYLALATGLRRGELMGLEWKDINFAQSTLEVRQCSQYLPGKGSFTKDPKNELSQRVIAIPHSVMAMLKQFKKQQAEERLKVGDLWQGSDRIFTTWDGQPAHPEWPSQWFSKFIKKHGLPHLTFHGLRHTSATMLIGQGVNMKEVSSRLGHSNISTTMDIYADSLKSADKDAAEKMDLFLNSIKQPAN